MHALLFVALLSRCYAHPVFRLVPVVSRTTSGRDASGDHAAMSVTFRVRVVDPARVPARNIALRDHANGHAFIARRLAGQSTARLEATGNSTSQVRLRLQDALRRFTRDVNAELAREERVYDGVTERGAAQNQGPSFGFPGGPDGPDLCP